MIRVFRTGAHAMRTPLSYSALAPLFADTIKAVDRPEAADLYIFAHIIDIEAAPLDLIEDWRARRRPVILLSEEPFWDTIWGRRPLDRLIHVETAYGCLPVIQINHQTSPLFHFHRIPYYLLTNHRFANTYRNRFARNARISSTEWQRLFSERSYDVSFMFERRPEPYHAMRWPEADLIGLCSWRTELAATCQGSVERLGQSWRGGKSRFELQNWYLDKIVQLDGRTQMIGALENTHQPQYITEKIFDAFACGALPLYFASAGHWLHELGLPEESWVNLYGLTPEAAAEKVAAVLSGPISFDAFHAAQVKLAAWANDSGAWVAERDRLRLAMLEEMERVLS